MIEENISTDVRKYYLLRYAVIGLVLLSSGVVFGVSLVSWGEQAGGRALKEQVLPEEETVTPALTTPAEEFAAPARTAPVETVTPALTTPAEEFAAPARTAPAEGDAAEAFVSAPITLRSLGPLVGIILLIFGISYATYARISIPGFVRGYVEEQSPFWSIAHRFKTFLIKMDGTSLQVRFSPKVRRGRSALRIELPLTPSFQDEQIRRICEQNGVKFSEAENLIYTIVAPEELHMKLLLFSRVVRQIEALKPA